MKAGRSNVEITGNALKIDLKPAGESGGASRTQIDAWLEKGRGGFETEDLREAFLLVADADHWKNDIDAIVPAGMREVLAYAIPWHTGGGDVRFEDLGDGTLRVTAPGYWSNGMEG